MQSRLQIMENTADIKDAVDTEDTADVVDTADMEDTADTVDTADIEDTADIVDTADMEDTTDTVEVADTVETRDPEQIDRLLGLIRRSPVLLSIEGSAETTSKPAGNRGSDELPRDFSYIRASGDFPNH